MSMSMDVEDLPIAPPSKKARVVTEQDVEEKTQREWLLQCPETYIGAVELSTWWIPVFENGNGTTVVWKQVTLSPGLVHLFLELVVNALDNGFRDDSQTYIHMEFKDGNFTVCNDGSAPPVTRLPGSQRYKIAGCFGGFQVGSNFDNTKKRYTGGKNGIGAAAANTFGKRMKVTVVNAIARTKYVQEWERNMSVEHNPKITTIDKKKNETTVEWSPDYERFPHSPEEGNANDLDDTVSFLAYCASLCAPPNVKVKYNGTLIKTQTPEQFCKLLGGTAPFAKDTVTTEDGIVFQVCVGTRSETQPNFGDEVSGVTLGFVNSTPCSDGSHADYLIGKIKDIVEEKAKTKKGKGDLHVVAKPAFVRKNTIAILKILVDKPRYRSQGKSALDTKVGEWGWSWKPSHEFIGAIERSSLVQRVIEAARQKSDSDASKATKLTGKKHPTFGKYDSAGELYKPQTTLLVTEGDSAKNFAVSGVSVVGRRHWGIYPIRGKFLNVRGVTPSKIADNKEAKELLQILGLSPNPKDNVGAAISKLPYGRLMVLADQDVDGSHIASLLYNLVEVCAPELLRTKPGFVCRFATALIRVKVPGRGDEALFYSEAEYETWRATRTEAGLSTGKATYYKGLGTSNASLAKEYFRNIHANTIVLKHSGGKCSESLDLFFNKARADDRKNFLTEHGPGDGHVDYSQPQITMEEFVHKELLPAYAWAAIERGIPALDGLNNARRKILWAMRALGMTKDPISVANASGKISSKSNYHHRGSALENAIIGMAADYVGAGNVNLLVPLGQFGTRHSHEAASAAYPQTHLNCPLHSLIYPVADDAALKYVNDEGHTVQPTIFVPIISMALCFGGKGIAVGWSTDCPCYNPIDVVKAAEAIVDGTDMPALHPFYRGFEGDVIPQQDGTYIVRGKCHYVGNDLHVTEVPPFKETDAYKEDWLKHDDLAPGGIQVMDGHTDEKVHLVLKGCKVMVDPISQLGLEKRLTFNNVYLLNEDGRVKKYTSPYEVVHDHAKMRLALYAKRLEHQRKECEEELEVMKCKAAFILKVIDGSFVMKDHDDDDAASATLSEMPEFANVSVHSTLLKMPGNSQTRKKVDELVANARKKEEELSELYRMTAETTWKKELLQLKEELMKDSRLQSVY
jgi:DNA topoisomerase-2